MPSGGECNTLKQSKMNQSFLDVSRVIFVLKSVILMLLQRFLGLLKFGGQTFMTFGTCVLESGFVS